jgi:glycosyltransferase involved in cell wall biosynthesis
VVDLGSRSDVPDLMIAADAYVVPSRWEGLGSVLIEAMALGAPVVASAVGPIPEVVGSGWARLVPADDPLALSEGILATVRQPAEERDRRAEVARRRFETTFTVDHVADAMVEFYERALHPRSR